jgi:hypothetical protein
MYEDYENQLWPFLIELNTKTGPAVLVELMVDERAHDPDNWAIRFEANLTSIYISGASWSASDAFVSLVRKLTKKYFGVDEVHFNNTRCIFWIAKAGIIIQ